ncbi:MAG TPA: DUF3837 domain-containing protein [Candidatus Eisenbergiella merdipullorum]|uniref:DUF3837 domain-containing protein n=1 Tax=Candidatus Eisenbergiella merdipullorum TaxID=2838553 RepID=A0A9D2I6H7_9FIRM|nr:DUF3837 domain-containing protein [Candidatus Eisenbergiella merdipullorum]
MVPVLARMAVIIKADHETNIITGNYEMAYICGLLCRLSGASPAIYDSPEAMRQGTLAALESYRAQDAREENLLRMLKAYKPETIYDDQVQELYRMGLEENRPWQK